MRSLAVLLFVPAVTVAQTEKIDAAVKEKLATLKYVQSLRDATTGAYKVTADGKPSLRACNGAVRAIKTLGGEITGADKLTAFVLSCYDPATGAFAEPGGKPDVAITSVGVMAAAELGIPKEKYKGAMGYLAKHAKAFEEVRIAAAAVEAWGVKDCPFDLAKWDAVADEFGRSAAGTPREGGAREVGSVAALKLRLGLPFPAKDAIPGFLQVGQLNDGGWGKTAEASDLETTYRVMRAMYLLKAKPDPAGVRRLVASCRNADGGYGVTPKAPSSMSGVYYATTVEKWLKELEK